MVSGHMFHVYFSSGSVFSGDTESHFDLTEDELRDLYIRKREVGEPVWVNGKEFLWSDAEFKIFEGPATDQIDEFSPVFGAAFYELGDKFADVTGSFVTSSPGGSTGTSMDRPETGDAVFVVHGRNNAVKDAVARSLETMLDDVAITILHEQPNAGASLIEKFERSARDAGFAVVILTADDIGGIDGELAPRARQNVVFEAGYFFGAIGRSRVAVLYEEGVQLPSDIHGLAYIPIDQSGLWRVKLGQELRAAGFDADLNQLAV